MYRAEVTDTNPQPLDPEQLRTYFALMEAVSLLHRPRERSKDSAVPASGS